jgi:DNA-binding SARP family transcriptional activator/TolB-like protein
VTSSESPLRLTLLGEVGLRSATGPVTRILAQPRRLALLVRLAVGAPGAFVRRDHLLAMFWPDADESRARGSLRQAIRYLRQGLGPEVVVGRGDDEVGVDPSRLVGDVAAFDQALDEGRDAAALALYRGELLPGFLVAHAPEFERWLSAERRRLRAAALDAAVRLAEAAESADRREEARELLGRAVRIDPLNESVVRRQLQLLDRLGDRGSALAAYRELEGRLRDDLHVEPAPETAALAARIRDRGGAGTGAGTGTGTDSAGSGIGASAPSRSADGSGAGSAAGRRPDRERVVVTRFRNATSREELDLLEAMVPDWITQGLSAIPGIQVVPPVLTPPPAPAAAGDPEGAPGAGRAHLAAVARTTGAGIVIQGAIYPEGDAVRFRVQIVDTVEDRVLPAPADVVVPAGELPGALEQVSQALNAALAPLLNRRAVHLRGSVRPPSFHAYRAYMEGLELFIGGRWRAALERFRRASEEEPTYALPLIVQAISHWNLEELHEAEAVAREAATLRRHLGAFEAAALDMVRSWLVGDWLGALEAVRIQAGLAPGASIPHFGVAEEMRRLNRPGEARAVLERLDPEAGELDGWIFYWIELATVQHLLGDHAAELRSARKARVRHPDDPVPLLLEVRALAARGEVEELEGVLDAAEALPRGDPGHLHEGVRELRPGDMMLEAGLELAAHDHGQGGAASAFLERSAAWFEARVTERSPEDLQRQLARSLYHAGRYEASEAIFRRLAGAAPAQVRPVGFHHGSLMGHMDHGYLALMAAHRGDTEGVREGRRALHDASGPFLFGAPWFWLACLDAVEGESDRASARLRRALAEGMPHEISLHADPHLRRLAGHPRYAALMRPRG